MAITPTSIIALSGLVKGSGLQIPSELTGMVSSIQTNPFISGVSSLTGPLKIGGLTLPAPMSSLPSSLSSLTQLQGTASGVLTQAQAILPSGGADPASGIKSFVGVMNSSTAFGSASAEWSAALTEFSGKSFGDLGINMSNYQDVISNGTTSIAKGFSAVTKNLQSQAFGSLSGAIDQSMLTNITASLKSSATGDMLQGLGSGLKNFGKLFDFTNPSSLGPKNLIANLQRQGLCDRTGINDVIANAGYDPRDLANVPDSVLTEALSQVQGNDLKRILSQTGASPASPIQSAAGLLQITNILPKNITGALGLANKGMSALSSLGSTLSNLGTSADNFKMADLMSGMETKSMQYLDQVKQLIPTDVTAAIKPMLGVGSGNFGNPQMKDMLGTVAGIGHTSNFKSALSGVSALQTTPAASTLTTAGLAYQDAVQNFINLNPGATIDQVLADPTVIAAQSVIQSAADGFHSSVANNSSLQGLVSGINASVSKSTSQLSTETQNLSLAGLSMVAGGLPVVQQYSKGFQSVMGFASKLHTMGVDKQNLGFNDFLPKMASADAAGDAIQASMVEGRNVSRAAEVGQPPAAVADEKATIAEASAGNLDELKTAYMNAAAEADKASKALFRYKGSDDAEAIRVSENYENTSRARDEAKTVMLQAAKAAGIPASQLPVYKSDNSFV
jgi:hypothetical protein